MASHLCRRGVASLRSELPVRVEAAMALRGFIDELEDPSALQPILPQLMDSIFKLMSEVRRASGLGRVLHSTLGCYGQHYGELCAGTC